MATSSWRSRQSILAQLPHVSQEQDSDTVLLDHSYAKPWNTNPSANNARPISYLFMTKPTRSSLFESTLSSDLDEVDVETEDQVTVPLYDQQKARTLMSECEQLVGPTTEDFDDKISRTGWTIQQNRLYNRVIKALNSHRLARLAYQDHANEPVMRRIYVNKTAKRIRYAFASSLWDMKLIHWLQSLLIDNLSPPLMAIYLDVLQTLKPKIPSVITPLTDNLKVTMGRDDIVSLLEKNPWDPVAGLLSQGKLTKLSGNPLLVVVPDISQGYMMSDRVQAWNTHLGGLGKVIVMSMDVIDDIERQHLKTYTEAVMSMVKARIEELKASQPQKPIIVIGWHLGAVVALQACCTQKVAACVCLGFPCLSIDGCRGDVDDTILDCRTTTLFVIGQHAQTCPVDDIEDLRDRMAADTSLLMIGGADDLLRISHAKQKMEGVTQAVMDRCIQEKIASFSVVQWHRTLPTGTWSLILN